MATWSKDYLIMKTEQQLSAVHWATMNQKDGYFLVFLNERKNFDCCLLSYGWCNIPKHWQYSLLVHTLYIHFTSSDSGSQWYRVDMTPPLTPNLIGITCLNALVAFEFPFWILEKFWWCYSTVRNFSGISQEINRPTSWAHTESTRSSFAQCTYHRDCHQQWHHLETAPGF